MFGIHLVDPVILPHGQEHGVLIPDLLEDGHGHVRHLVPGAIEVGTDSLLQVGPGLAVSPRKRIIYRRDRDESEHIYSSSSSK